MVMKGVFLVLAFLNSALLLQASSISTPIQSIIGGVKYGFQYFYQINDKRLPKSLEDLADTVNVSYWKESTGRHDVDDIITLIFDKSESNNRIVAITSGRVLEDRRKSPGRYIAWKRDNEFFYTWESEDVVIDFFRKRDLKLPSAPSMRQPNILGNNKVFSSKKNLEAYDKKEELERQRIKKAEKEKYEEWKNTQNKSKQIAKRNELNVYTQENEDKEESGREESVL